MQKYTILGNLETKLILFISCVVVVKSLPTFVKDFFVFLSPSEKSKIKHLNW